MNEFFRVLFENITHRTTKKQGYIHPKHRPMNIRSNTTSVRPYDCVNAGY